MLNVTCIETKILKLQLLNGSYLIICYSIYVEHYLIIYKDYINILQYYSSYYDYIIQTVQICVQLYQFCHNDTYQIYTSMLGILHIASFTIIKPIICTTLRGIKTTYYLNNKYMGLCLFTMGDIISNTFRQPPHLIWQHYITAQAGWETRLWSLRWVIRVCSIVTWVFISSPLLAKIKAQPRRVCYLPVLF